MIITCEKCSVKFNLDEKLIKPAGSKVRCSQCKHIFLAFPPTTPQKPGAKPGDQIPKQQFEPTKVEAKTPTPTKKETAVKQAAPKIAAVAAAGATIAKAQAAADDGLDFSDLEKMLDDEPEIKKIEPTPAKKNTAKTPEEAIVEELDLSGLDEIIDSDIDTREGAEENVTLVFDLEGDSDDELESLESDAADEDLSELDGLLKSEKTAKAAKKEDEEDLSLGLEAEDAIGELDLDFDLETDEAEKIVAEAPELDLDLAAEDNKEGSPAEELELDLDLELESKESPKTDNMELDLDLEAGLEELTLESDSSDSGTAEAIEADLMSTKSIEEAKDSSDDLELELDIDEASDTEEKTSSKKNNEDELDIAELEQTLEMELLSPDSEGAEEEEPEDVELELADDDEGLEDLEGEQDEEVDVSDIEDMLDMDDEPQPAEAGGELEIEFDLNGQIEDEPEVDEKPAAQPAVQTQAKASAVEEESEFEETIDEAEVLEADNEPKKKNKALMIILILLILLVGAGGYVLLASMGIVPSLPFISFGQDQGKVEELQNTIKSDFINNDTIGRLFVISGQVQNNARRTQHSILVSANLYAKGKQLAKTVSAYAGNILTNEELATITQPVLDQRMTNKFNAGSQLNKLAPGAQMPFMIVIPNLPDNLEEYKVVVTESTPEE